MARDIQFGFGISVYVGGYPFVSRSGSVKGLVDLQDVSGTGAAGPSGTGRERAFGLDEAEVTLSLQADANQSPHMAPFSIQPRTPIPQIDIYYWGPNNDPYTLRNIMCDTPFDAKWDATNPNAIDIHGFTNDYDVPQ